MSIQTEIVSQEKRFRKHVALAAGSLMLTMAMWALASPLGATPDEWLHLGSIWSANGVDDDHCHKISSKKVLTASADIDQFSCLTPNRADFSLCGDLKTDGYLMPSTLQMARLLLRKTVATAHTSIRAKRVARSTPNKSCLRSHSSSHWQNLQSRACTADAGRQSHRYASLVSTR